MSADDSLAAARVLAALARCHARFADVAARLRERPDVLDARRHLYLHALDGGGARAELGVDATIEARGRAASWYLAAEWAAGQWSVQTCAFLNVRGHATPLRPTARWAGAPAAEFADVAERAARELTADVGTVALAEPEAARAASAARIANPNDSGPPAIFGVPRADLVRAYTLDGMAPEEAARFVDAMIASGSTRPIPGGVQHFGIEDLVPLAHLGPPLSEALRTRLERDVADTRRLLAEEEAALERLRAILRAAG